MSPVPPLGTRPLLLFLLQVGLLLLFAVLLGRLAVRMKLPAVVGELTAGIFLGPSLFQNVAPVLFSWLMPHQAEQIHLLDAVGQIGVLLLVGVTGCHLDLALVRRKGATAARVSLFGLIIPFGLGIVTAYFVPAALLADGVNVTVFALFLGVAMCVSAIPVIAKTLIDMNLLHRDIGQLTLASGMVDDVFGWFMLSVVSSMAVTGMFTGTAVSTLVSLVGVLVFAVFVGRPFIRWVFRIANASADATPTIAAIVVLTLLSAAGSHALHLEAVFGAFVCGILIGEAGKPDPARLAPLRTIVLSVFAPIFFATAGLRMDLTALLRAEVFATAVLVLLIAIVGKFIGAYIGARLSRLSRWEALALGAGMNARGVVEIIVAMVGLRLGILTTETYTIIVLVAVITSVMAPPILRIAISRIPSNDEERARESKLHPAISA